MYLIVGLGNPGMEYDGTRHNIGFAAVDAIASDAGISFKRGLGDFAIAKSTSKGLVLIKPSTYMNRSGSAVRVALKQHNIEIPNLVVISDDFHIPIGTIRLREKGSAGGHNGLTSIIDSLGTNEFCRIRCGIANSSMPRDKEYISDFVLGRFKKGEQAEVQSMIEHARDAVLMTVSHGFSKAMNTYNIQP